LGDRESNIKIALRRAATIANVLADNNVDFDIIAPIGIGPENFLYPNNPESQYNLRVEIKVIRE
jgi:outer membrane protein OmpA-like peptidoglycan-associated protein